MLSSKIYYDKINKGNGKRGLSPRLRKWPGDLDLWPMTYDQNLLRTKYVPSLVKIHWRMLILECSQECYGRTNGRTDGSVTISLRNFVGEGIINKFRQNVIDTLCLLILLLYPSQRSCRGILVSPCPSVCRKTLCRTITWVVFLRIFHFWRFSLLPFQSYWI
jgi:hypothetical protein